MSSQEFISMKNPFVIIGNFSGETRRSRRRAFEQRSVCSTIHEQRRQAKPTKRSAVYHEKFRLSYEGRTVNALALGAEEGRDEQRNALGSCK